MRLGFCLFALVITCGCKSGPFSRDRKPADREVIEPPQNITPFWPSDPKPTSDSPPINWSNSNQGININAPSQIASGQDLPVRLEVVSRSATTVRHTVPSNVQILRTDPPARLSGSELIWDLLPTADARQSINVLYRPSGNGAVSLRAEAIGADGAKQDAHALTQIGVGQIALQVTGPNDARPGDRVAYDVRLVNSGQAPISRVVLRAELDLGLDHESGYRQLEIPIEMLRPGEAKFVQLPLTVRNGGRLKTIVSANAEGGVTSKEEKNLEVRESRVLVRLDGPSQVILQRPGTWKVTVQNSGMAIARNVQLQVTLPNELKPVSVSAGGRIDHGVLTWNFDSLNSGERRSLELIATPIAQVRNATLVATITGDGATPQRADQSVEIVGIPLLKVSLTDSDERIAVGQRVVYTAEVRNAGSVPLEDIQLSATLSAALRPQFGFGPTMARITSDRIDFGAIERLEPGKSIIVKFEAEAISPADARVIVEAKSRSLPTPVFIEEATRVTGPMSQSAKGDALN